jgi:hypothetical protein
MSKRANRAARDTLAQVDGKALKRHVQRSVFPIADVWTADLVAVLDDTAASVGNDVTARPAIYGFTSLKLTGGQCRISKKDLLALVRHSVQAGFGVAMRMHQQDLLTTADAAVIVGGQRQGHVRGHESQSQARERRAAEIRETWARLEAAGEKATYEAVAALVGYSRSTVERAINNRATKPAAR